MTHKQPPPPHVAITRCENCGLEVYDFRPDAGECSRCGQAESQRFTRWINNPAPKTMNQAWGTFRQRQPKEQPCDSPPSP